MPFIENCFIKSSFDCPDNIREDVLDVMVNISPTRTPFLSGWRKTVARAVVHEWQVDWHNRSSDPDNPVVQCARESSDFDFQELHCPCRVGNQLHILRETGDVSWLQRALNTIGYADEYAYQVDRRMKDLALDTEFALIHSVRGVTTQVAPQADGVCASPSGCRTMDGVLSIAQWDETTYDCLDELVQGTVLDYTGSPCQDLSPYLIDNLLQIMYHKGAEPNVIYVNSTLKRLISSFYFAGQTRNITVAEQKLVNSIDIYESDFGTLAIQIHLDMPTDALLALDEQYMALAFAYPARVEALAKVSNSDKFGMEHCLTLEARAMAAIGVILGLCTNDVLWCHPCDTSANPVIAPATNLPR
jgi:hypothetical protein